MKVLLHHFTPFALAHGGEQIQIERTRAALEESGVEADFLRWYDGGQQADVLHFFGRIPSGLVQKAHDKGIKVVQAELLTEMGSRSGARLKLDKIIRHFVRKALPRNFQIHLDWDSYRKVDACVALTTWEAQLMVEQFEAPTERVHVIPNGVEDVFLKHQPTPRGRWLVCTTTITERKRVLEMAEAAVLAKTPLWIVGKPYADTDPYGLKFTELARRHPELLRYEGANSDRARLARIYREARGFVLLSAMESLSLSALEAAACECPLLLSDLPWARTVFQDSVTYCPVSSSATRTAAILRSFYDAAPQLQPPAKPAAWPEVASQLKKLYASLLNTSR
jgi:glycosyltransferase involved in cell wall biosynthesis